MAPYQEAADKENAPTSTIDSLNKQFGENLDNLQQRLDKKEITEKQFKADKQKLTSEWKSKTNEIKKSKENLKKTDEKISKSNVKSSKETQEAYDKGVEDGGVTREGGKNIFSSKL